LRKPKLGLHTTMDHELSMI